MGVKAARLKTAADRLHAVMFAAVAALSSFYMGWGVEVFAVLMAGYFAKTWVLLIWGQIFGGGQVGSRPPCFRRRPSAGATHAPSHHHHPCVCCQLLYIGIVS